MYCLKCGKETNDDQAFCLECQKEMAKYPIDPGVAVQILPRRQTTQKKTSKRRITPEEQVKILRKRVRLYACLFLAALIVVVCLCVPLVLQIQDERGQIGKNYVTIKPGTVPTIPVSEPQ